MIYLDYNATTPVAPEVTEAIAPYIKDQFGNPGSGHVLGMIASEAVNSARTRLMNLIGATDGRIVFTGCATEANNLAIKGVAEAAYEKGRHIISTAVEHPSVIEPLKYLQKYGWEITLLPVDAAGMPDPDQLTAAIRKDTILVSIMLANNETGAILPVPEYSAITREREIIFHTDCSQAMGKIPVGANAIGADLLTMAGHKFYAPKGIGALYVRQGTDISSQLHGGGQEHGLRSGTENVPYIAGIGKAAELALDSVSEKSRDKMIALAKRLRQAISSEVEVELLGHETARLPNTVNLAFIGCKGERVLQGAPDVAASLGAACHDKHVNMSPVLAAMGIDPMVARGAVRLSLGRFTTEDEVDTAAGMLIQSAKEELKRGSG